jgi:5'-methylthioadenosine phosphorylase
VSDSPRAEVGILGGSGLYELVGLDEAQPLSLDTPFGPPSDELVLGRVGDRRVAFLARHGRGHRLTPSEIDYRANIWALKRLGVTRVLSASAVGSMREDVHPRDVVLPTQFIDRTRQRVSTFFGDGLVAHITFSDPICEPTRKVLLEAARARGATAHDGGIYLCMEGPAFSTRAESLLYRSWGVDVIGMTNLQEAKLAREAELCYATLALVTDYDCWHDDEDDVSVEALLGNLRANAELAAGALRAAVEALPATRAECGCADALRTAIITAPDAVPQATRERLELIAGRYLSPGESSS